VIRLFKVWSLIYIYLYTTNLCTVIINIAKKLSVPSEYIKEIKNWTLDKGLIDFDHPPSSKKKGIKRLKPDNGFSHSEFLTVL
jgi:hypothetical protein